MSLMQRTQSLARAPPRGSLRNLPLDEAGTRPLVKLEARVGLAAGKDWRRRLGNVTFRRDNVRLSMSR